MALPPDFALILDHARAEAKRYGHGEVVLEHLAAALARRNARTFADAFGADAEARLEPMLDRLPAGRGAPTDSLKLIELLANAAASPRKTEVLIDAVRGLLQGTPAVAPVAALAKEAARAPEPELEPQPAAPPVQPVPLDKRRLLEQLRSRIIGQDAALEVIVDRLTLTRMQFDLRPHRPDGVFLLAGASGTGKTAFARALAEFLYGNESRLISLDMSEYAHDWAVSRLIGPQPGYVGSDKPDGWLTTRVRRQPESLVLLDEIEKSHPTVWNTFLQVFNDGRLTDGQGNEADFSRTVVVMTSNLGSESYRRRHPIGFHPNQSFATELGARTRDAIKESMPPEFVNRLDAIVIFNSLTPDNIREIARREIAHALARLRERGYDTEVPDDVVSFIADHGYDPGYGARHLQRSIEQHLLQTLLNFPPAKLRAQTSGNEVTWQTVSPPTT